MKTKSIKIELNRWLSKNSKYSRRKATDLIKTGHVKVNDKIALVPFTKIDPSNDKIQINNTKVEMTNSKLVYYAINKPKGYVSSTKTDSSNSPPITSLILEKNRIYPIGRLDIESQGLMLLTNDGSLTYKLTHPNSNIEKEYLVKIKGNLTSSKIDLLENGIMLKEGKTKPSQIKIIDKSSNKSEISIAITEGKNRQIRRMLAKVDLHVENLTRIRIGELNLGNLKIGEYRALTPKEVESLRK